MILPFSLSDFGLLTVESSRGGCCIKYPVSAHASLSYHLLLFFFLMCHALYSGVLLLFLLNYPKFSGKSHNHFIMLTNPVGKECASGAAEMSCLCSMVPGPLVGNSNAGGDLNSRGL